MTLHPRPLDIRSYIGLRFSRLSSRLLATASDHHDREAVTIQSLDERTDEAFSQQRVCDFQPVFEAPAFRELKGARAQRKEESIVTHETQASI